MDSFTLCLSTLCEKWIHIEDKDFFKHIPYELTQEAFENELYEHDYNLWIPIHCQLKNVREDDYKQRLWNRYCGHKF